MKANLNTTFAGIYAENAIDVLMLENAREEYGICEQEYINEGDLEILIRDTNFDDAHDVEVLHKDLSQILDDVRERVSAAADPGRHGYTLKDVSFSVDDVGYRASDRMEERMHEVADDLNVTLEFTTLH